MLPRCSWQVSHKENIGLIKNDLFIEEIPVRPKNVGAIPVMNMDIMLMNVQKDLTKRKLN